MSRIQACRLALVLAIAAVPVWAPLQAASRPKALPATYSMADFARVRKYDAHVHVNVDDDALVRQARRDGFRVLSINVDYPDFPPIDVQHGIALKRAKADPVRFQWAATFSMAGYGTPQWLTSTRQRMATQVGEGARAIKIWKNVGMGERTADGRLLMLDDAGLVPVLEAIQALGVPLIGHQGEPHNCWLPLEQMTTDNDREYFKAHPQYHMYLHPEQPSYDDQMAVRDRVVAAHPQLRFVGAHMASLEWNVDRLAAFLDAHPHAVVDLAARMAQVQYQSVRDRARVRRFFIRYQDRLLYGTDLTHNADTPGAQMARDAHAVWRADWRYLATGLSQHVDTLHADVRGLALPRAVIDKLYYRNAMRTFGAPR